MHHPTERATEMPAKIEVRKRALEIALDHQIPEMLVGKLERTDGQLERAVMIQIDRRQRLLDSVGTRLMVEHDALPHRFERDARVALGAGVRAQEQAFQLEECHDLGHRRAQLREIQRSQDVAGDPR
jgi:pyruvate kinase